MENSRISTVDHEAVSQELSSAHDESNAFEGAALPLISQNSEIAEFQLAQLDQANGKTDRVPASEPPQNNAPQIVQVTPDQGNIVQLPPNTAIDDIQVEGRNLVLVQADGSRIIVVNGALNIPTFVIGEVTLPQQVLLAALQQQGVNVAAGPNGSYSASNTSSGHEFTDSQVQNAHTPPNLLGLLGPTDDSGNGGGNGSSESGDGLPFINPLQTVTASLSERGTSIGGFVTTSSAGRFGFGGVNASISTVTLFGEAEITASGTQQLSGLTSGGVPVTVSQNGFAVTGTANGVTIFTLVFDRATGDYTFTQLAAIDHPAGANSATDLLQLQFQYTVIDKSGQTVKGIGTVDIADSVAVAGAGTSGTVSETALIGGNGIAADANITVKSAAGSLNISWGADSSNSDNGSLGDRSVVFTSAAVTASGEAGAALTSHGLAVSTTLLSDGTLVGYTGNAVPGSTGAANVVFYATLSDANNGSYNFTLVQSLDHASGANPLTLSFGYTAKDSDGDTSSNTVTLSIADDVPVTTGSITAGQTLNDDVQANGNVDGSDHVLATSGAAGALFTAGADGFASVTIGELPTFQAVFVDANGVGQTEAVNWGTASVSGGVTTWTAIGGTSNNLVATLTINADGSYSFKLSEPLAHTGTGQDQSSLTFNYTVTDGDGDKATGALTIDVTDDVPVTTGSVTDRQTLNDDVQANGNADGSGHVLATSGVAGALFTAGADGFASVTIGELPKFQVVYVANGVGQTESVNWGNASVSGGVTTWTAIGGTSGKLVATLTIDADGSYSFKLSEPLAHTATGQDQSSLTFNYTVTDGDGDKATGALTIDVTDDVPVTTGSITDRQTLNDDVQANGNNDGSGHVLATTGAAGALFTAGADGFASVSIAELPTFRAVFVDATTGIGQTEAVKWGTASVSGGATTWTALGVTSGKLVATLTIDADGSYSFKLSEPLAHTGTGEDSTSVTFNYTVTDGDKDTATGSLTINVTDDVPLAHPVEAVTTLSDVGLPLSDVPTKSNPSEEPIPLNADLPPPVESPVHSVSGTGLFERGADGFKSLTFTPPGELEAIIVGKDGVAVQQALRYTTTTTGEAGHTILTATIGETGRVAFTLDVAADGSYVFTTSAPLVHSVVAAETLDVKIGFSVTDGDGDVATGGLLTIRVADDVPATTESVIGQTLSDDAQSGGNIDKGDEPKATATGDAGALFTTGADGFQKVTLDSPADFNVIYRDISSVGHVETARWGKATVSDGATTWTATAGEDNHTVATLTIGSNGSYSFTLNEPMAHTETNETSLTFNYTVTDGDGDTATGELKIGVMDDVPTVSVKVGSFSVTADESAGLQPGDTSNLTVFDGVTTVGQDTDNGGEPLAYAQSKAGALSDITVFGADGAAVTGSKVYSLSLSSAGVDSGLTTTDGTPIKLYSEDTLIVGRVGAENGAAAFAVAIDPATGRVSTVEYLSLHNGNANDPNDIVSISAGRISAVLTVTDGDGSKASGSADISTQIHFADDAPITTGSITATALNDDAQTGGNLDGVRDDKAAIGGVGALFSAGVDGLKSVSLNSPADFKAIYVDGNGVGHVETVKWGGASVVDGVTTWTAAGIASHNSVATLTIKADGSYSFALSQPLAQTKTGQDQAVLKFNYTVTDGDGDTATGSLTVNVTDDVPTVSVAVGSSITADESPLLQENDIIASFAFLGVEHAGAFLPLAFAQSPSAVIVPTAAFGADGKAVNGAVAYSLSLSSSGVYSGLKTTDGKEIFLFKEGNLVVGRYDGSDNGTNVTNTGRDPAALALSIGSDGKVTVVQYVSLHNGVGPSSDSIVAITDGAVSAVVTVKDGDGDTATAQADISAQIRFEDDGPQVVVGRSVLFSVTVDESTGLQPDDILTLSVFDGVTTVGHDSDNSGKPLAYAQSKAGALIDITVFGADGAAVTGSKVYSLSLSSAGVDSGLTTTDGTPIKLYSEDTLIVGRVGAENGAAAFAVAIDPATGRVSTVEYLSLHNGNANDPNDIVSISAGRISAVLTVTDGDGSKASGSADISTQIHFADDAPITTGSITEATVLNDDMFKGGNSDIVNENKTASGGPGTLFASGADGLKSVSINDMPSLKTIYVDTNGVGHQETVTWSSTATNGVTTWVASSAHIATVATLTINANGSYSFTTAAPLVHPTSATTEDDLALIFKYTVTDGDGDVDTGSLTIKVTDDVPTVSVAIGTSVTADESPLWQENDILFSTAFIGVEHAGAILPLAFAQSPSAVIVPTAAFGADGKAVNGAVAYSLSLSSSGVYSGLKTTDGKEIFLFKEGNLVVGRYDGSDNDTNVTNTGCDPAAFALSIGSDGKVTVVQYVSLHNGVGPSSDSIVAITDGAVSAVVTVKDGDGDTATAQADISARIRFEDDGPQVVVGRSVLFSVTVDESTGLQPDDILTLSVFDGVTTVGHDSDNSGKPLAYAQSKAGALIDITVFGADGAAVTGSKVYSLSLSSAGVDSGLTTTDGTPIKLYSEDTLIVGRVGAENGAAAFAVAIDPATGRVSTVEYLSLHNGNANDPNDIVSISAGRISAVLTVTDGDGSKASGSADISTQIHFADDAPTASYSGASVTEHGTVSGAFVPQTASGALVFSTGADGGAVTDLQFRTALNIDQTNSIDGFPALTSHGVALSYATTLVGAHIILTATANGSTVFILDADQKTGAFTFTQSASIDHPVGPATGANDDLRLIFDFTVTDGDGDKTAWNTGTVSIDIHDDVPTASYSGASVTEHGTVSGAFVPQTASGALVFSTGADGGAVTDLQFRTALNIDQTNSIDGFPALTSHGVALSYATTLVGAHIILTATANGSTVFILDADQKTGAFTFTQSASIDHPVGPATGANDDLRLIFDFTVTDGDGDKTAWNTGTVSIDIHDDVPTITGTAQAINLLTNGDFTSALNAQQTSYGSVETFDSGWKISGTAATQTGVQLEIVRDNYTVNGVVMHATGGAPMVDLDASPGDIAISQSISGLVAGAHYTLSFEAGSPMPTSAGLEIEWNGTKVDLSGHTITQTMTGWTIDLVAQAGPNSLTFKETGTPDNTGTYIANVALTAAATGAVPTFHGTMGEDDATHVFTLTQGTDFGFGADGAGPAGGVSFDTNHATISTATGTTLSLTGLTMSYDPSTGHVTLTPGSNAFNGLSAGQVATLSVPFTVTDGDGDSKAGAYQITITGTNDAPTVAISQSVSNSGYEDTAITLSGLSVNDVDAGSNAISVTLSVTDGSLSINGAHPNVGVQVNDGTMVLTGTKSDINEVLASQVRYIDSANHNGAVTLTISATDDHGATSVSQQTSINVVAVNDAPLAADKTIGIDEHTSHTFAAADFGFSDTADANSLAAIKVTSLPSEGTLTFNGNAVSLTNGEFVVAASDIGKLVFTPNANFGGGLETSSFQFKVQDDGGKANGGVDTSVASTMTFDIAAVNDGHATLQITDGTVSHPNGATYVVGDVLTASIGADPDGTASDIVYTWTRDNGDPLDTGTTYTLTAADIGHKVTATAAYVDGQGFHETVAVSLPTAVAAATTPGAHIYTDALASVSFIDDALAWERGILDPSTISITSGGSLLNGIVTATASDLLYKSGATTYQDGVSFKDSLSAHGTDTTDDILIATTSGRTLVSGSGNDVLIGKGGPSSIDWLSFFAEKNTMSGGSGNNLFIGGDGFVSDEMSATSGKNVYLLGSHISGWSAATTVVRGGSGNDTVDFSHIGAVTGAGVSFTLNASGSNGRNSFDLGGDHITYSSVEGVRGTAYADSLTLRDDGTRNTNYNSNLSVDGGAGKDTLYLDGSSYAWEDRQIVNIEAVAMTSQGTLDLSKQTEGLTITGTYGYDVIKGGTGNDIITSGGADDTLTGGGGTDTFIVNAAGTATVTDLSGSDVVKISNIAGAIITETDNWVATSDTVNNGTASINANGHTVDLSNAGGSKGWTVTNGSSTGATIVGSAKSDTITGGTGDDTITGGAGGDTMTGGGGNDTFVIGGGSSTIAAYDEITDFNAGDKLKLAIPSVLASNGTYSKMDGSNLGIINGTFVKSIVIADGIATFYSGAAKNPQIKVNDDTAAGQAAQVLSSIDIGDNGATVAFAVGPNSNNSHTFIFQQNGDTTNGTDTLVNLSHYAPPTSLNALITNHTIDPVILDLDHNGLALTSQSNGVSFDLNGDGAKDQVAWTAAGARDGILGVDLNHDGQINNGSELFTTSFNGGSYASGMAALATLDTNHDGKIDASDTAYSQLAVWQDLNHNGITDAGELTTLANDGISSISLSTTASTATIAGQSVLSEGTYTNADGSLGHLSEVAFDTGLGQVDAGQINLVGTDGSDTLTSGGGYTMTGGAGGDTFVLDARALHDLNMADVITDFSPKGDGDKLDVSNLLNALIGEHPGMADASALASMTASVNTATNSTAISINTGSEAHVVATLQNYAPTGHDAIHVLFNNHDEQLATHAQTAGA